MLRRCRSHLLVSLALAAPIAMPARAYAQGRVAPAASSAQARATGAGARPLAELAWQFAQKA